MFCRKCGTPTEGDATICPKCEALEQQQAQPATPAEEVPDIENILSTPQTEAPQTEAPVETEEVPFTLGTVEQEEPPKKGKFLKALLLIGGIAAVAALVFLVVSLVTRKNPEERYVALKEDFVESAVEGISQFYEGYEQGAEGTINAVSAKLRLLLGEQILSTLEPAAGMDLSWLSDMGLDIEFYPNANMTEAIMDLVVGGKEVLTMDMIVNSAVYYMSLPTLSSEFIKVTADDYTNALMDDMSTMPTTNFQEAQAEAEAMLRRLGEALPTQEQMQDMTRRYLTVILENLDNMTYEFQTVRAGQYEEELLVYTITLDNDTLTGIMLAAVEEMRTDKTLEEYLDKLSRTVGTTADLHAEFMNMLDQVDADVLGGQPMEIAPAFKLYLNDDDEVVGLTLLNDATDAQSAVMEAVLVEDGGNFGFYMNVEGQSAVTGEGEYSGDAVTGNFKIYDDGTEMLKISLQEVEISDAAAVGTIELRLGEALMEELMGSDASMMTMVNPVLVATFDVAEDGGFAEFYLKAMGQKMFGLSLEMEYIDNKPVSLPTSAYELEEAQQWLATFDIAAFKQNLLDAGLPQELVEQISLSDG